MCTNVTYLLEHKDKNARDHLSHVEICANLADFLLLNCETFSNNNEYIIKGVKKKKDI